MALRSVGVQYGKPFLVSVLRHTFWDLFLDADSTGAKPSQIGRLQRVAQPKHTAAARVREIPIWGKLLFSLSRSLV